MRGQGNDVGHPGAIPSQILFWEVSPLEFNFYEFLPFDMGSNEVLPVERDYHVYWNGGAEGILMVLGGTILNPRLPPYRHVYGFLRS